MNTVININEGVVENSEISQLAEEQPRLTIGAPQLGKISPNQQGQEGQMNVMPELGEISTKRTEENNPQQVTENRSEIPPKEPDEVTSDGNGRRGEGTNTRQEYIQ